MKPFIIFTFIVLITHGCLQAQQRKSTARKQQENKVVEMIAQLPQVMESDDWVKKVTKGQRHLISFISGEPTKENNYYSVTVGEDNGVSMVTHYLFDVNAKTYAIYFYSAADDKRIPLKLWQQKYYRPYRLQAKASK